MTNDILTVKEVAEYLKVNERTIYRLASSGELPAFRVGSSWRFRQHEIDIWIEKQSQGKSGD
ncbi:helix-turn-helix domain-containing protein [Endozoicomonas sp. G2_1]|uniref:helix-turn-helix domain-containing protein n=1 Tax=Endozoicomonas sp. G2_1 TaxID=2821091 RepID=UPI001ADB5C42|nr:helix-turn-helix domain-containing protein [Endozoicomonas sp. G2_1]MBO9491421.1 helix-turn-helix domain-containing protein [Endozoicomonas sp. G2_1]